MKLADAREAFYNHSGNASAVCRQAAFAGIALVWVFKTQTEGQYALPTDLMWPAIFLAATLGFDMLQYAVSSLIWGLYHRYMEVTKGVDYDEEFYPPAQFNWPANFFFWGKIALLIASYILLVMYIAKTIRLA